MEIVELIQSMGFPIAVAVGLALYTKDFVNNAIKDSHEREQKLIEANKRLSDTLKSVADITERASNQLIAIESRLDGLEAKIDDALKK